MSWTEIETNWDAFAPQLQERWGRLTNDDLIAAREGADQLLSCVLKRYRMDPEVAQRHVDDWIKSASELSIIAARGANLAHIEASAPGGERPGA